jgi:hypothetical protein
VTGVVAVPEPGAATLLALATAAAGLGLARPRGPFKERQRTR